MSSATKPRSTQKPKKPINKKPAKAKQSKLKKLKFHLLNRQGGWSRKKPVALLFAFLFGCIGLYLLVFSHAATITGPLVPSDGHVMFGATQANFLDFQHITGRDQAGRKHLELMRIFYGFNTDFSTQGGNLKTALDNDSIPVISVGAETQNWSTIANGGQDARLAQQKAMLKTIPVKFFLSFQHEPTARVNSGEGRTPASYVAAFKHFHDYMLCKNGLGGANCVPLSNAVWTWIMIPNPAGDSATFWTANASGWYPGDSYVDWLGADPYLFECPAPTAALPKPSSFTSPGNNTYSGGKNALAASIGSRLQFFYQWATVTKGNNLNMPIILAEWGTNVHYNSDGSINDMGAAAWIAAAKNDLRNNTPNVRAISYFDSNGNGNARCDHRILATAPHTNVIREITAMANDVRYVGGTQQPSPTPIPAPAPSTTDARPVIAPEVIHFSPTEGLIVPHATDDKAVSKVVVCWKGFSCSTILPTDDNQEMSSPFYYYQPATLTVTITAYDSANQASDTKTLTVTFPLQ